MKREELIAMGISEEDADKVMADYGSAVQRANAKAGKYKTDAQKAAELQAELDRINEQNLSDIEKANKATETANNRVAELEKQIKAMQTKASLAELGIVGEQAEKLISVDGAVDFAVLGQIISDRETKAAAKKEEDLLDNTHNPGGGTGGSPEDNKPEDVKNAESITFGGLDKNAQSARDYYK